MQVYTEAVLIALVILWDLTAWENKEKKYLL